MSLDPQTLLTLNVANLSALAILLPIIMGRRLSVPELQSARVLVESADCAAAQQIERPWPMCSITAPVWRV
jgi:hypothetical protein